MPFQLQSLSEIFTHQFDDIIDVRSPAEFAIDHIPGAINLPALSDAERAEIGTIYTQVSPFLARKKGASCVLRNVADHLAGPLMDQPGSWQPLIYCWRGGQRSGVFTTLLKEVGWRAERLQAGYQSYRRLIKSALYDQTLPHHFILLDGYTGTAKTALLPHLQTRGIQTLDLEGLARHRGSLLGALPGGQPAQRGFETTLAHHLHHLDPNRPVIVEAESSKIGQINLPPALWAAMRSAPRITLDAPLTARVQYIAKEYADILRAPETVQSTLAPLRRLRGHAVVDHWQALQDAQDYTGLSAALITDHYDPAYAKARHANQHRSLGTVIAETLDEGGLNKAADRVVAYIKKTDLTVSP
jgi:tRNA 2-selenouridine synthase